jgi:hypothetical protein
MKISDWKALNKNTLRGIFTLALPSGMAIHGCMLHVKNGSRWIGLPAKEYQVNGERKFSRLIEFTSKDRHERFQAEVLTALDAMQVAA